MSAECERQAMSWLGERTAHWANAEYDRQVDEDEAALVGRMQ